MRKFAMLLHEELVFNDFELADMPFSRYYIYVEGAGGGGGAIYRHLKWEIYSIFRIFKEPRVYEGSLSSLERLRITESILEELV
jgi:hypothetical protein